jgi:hypothetical protein
VPLVLLLHRHRHRHHLLLVQELVLLQELEPVLVQLLVPV